MCLTYVSGVQVSLLIGVPGSGSSFGVRGLKALGFRGDDSRLRAMLRFLQDMTTRYDLRRDVLTIFLLRRLRV